VEQLSYAKVFLYDAAPNGATAAAAATQLAATLIQAVTGSTIGSMSDKCRIVDGTRLVETPIP
jgi:hypothetical protein